MLFGTKFGPYPNMQELNLDWIMTKIKNMLRFLPDDGSVGQILRRTPSGAEWSNESGGGGAVNSVNGQTGDVVLTAADVNALPDTYTAPVSSVNSQTGAVVLTKSDIGLSNVTNDAQYCANNPPPYPVTSVNGQTGAVIVSGGAVDSVNGQTGTVVLTKSDIGLANVTNDAQYCANNPPPYPVTSVNGSTGAVTINTHTIVYNDFISGTTDATGNLVLGTAYDNRCIVNVQTTNTLVVWALGVAGASNNKMLHFWDYQGNTLASTSVGVRVFWIDENSIN